MEPYRCPKCNALVVDRRSAKCTTCHEALPAAWVLTPDQVGKLTTLDAHARAEHAASMNEIDSPIVPDTGADVPLVDPGT